VIVQTGDLRLDPRLSRNVDVQYIDVAKTTIDLIDFEQRTKLADVIAVPIDPSEEMDMYFDRPFTLAFHDETPCVGERPVIDALLSVMTWLAEAVIPLEEALGAAPRAGVGGAASSRRSLSVNLSGDGSASAIVALESQLAAAQELSTTLTADLQGSVAQRESLEAEVLPLRSELEELRNAQAQRLEQAPAQVPGSEESLQRALDEAAEYKATVIAQQQRMTELEQLVEGYRELIESETPIAAPPAKPSVEEAPPTPTTASELAAVIEVAEQAVANILDSTRVRADEELRAVDDERERIERDIESMTSWRDRAAPMIASLQAALDEIKIQAVEIGRGIDEALRPVATAVDALTAQLTSLDDLARAPVESAAATAPSEDDSVTVIPEERPPSPDFPDGYPNPQ